ncbi:MAG: PAS domain S-box protein [Candidatus Bathyarchaeota archaeon]|nr:PAS domain S-box protein [Candidatus Bathyarchaeota archaeon]
MATAPSKTSPAKIRVLLVDDEASQIEIVKMNLCRMDPNLDLSSSKRPSEVLKLLTKEHFDCIVSDYVLPVMTGIQLCREIRKTSRVPFILYTGRGSEEVASEAFSAGVDAYIKKESELAHYIVLSNLIKQAAEKWRTERLLQESEQRLRLHIENTPVGVIEWDSDFVVTRWSGEAERIFGLSPAETVGKPFNDLKIVYEEDAPIVEHVMSRLANGVTTRVTYSNRNYTKTGRVIHCTWYSSVLKDERGKMASVMSLVLDITSTIESEESLRRLNQDLKSSKEQLQRYVDMLEERVAERTLEIRETKERLESFMDSAPDAIMIYDPGLRLLDLNNAALRFYPNGTSRKDLIGKRMADLTPGIEATARFKGFQSTLETGEEYHEEGHRIVSNLGEGLASTWAFRMGKNLGIISRDVTQRENGSRRAQHAEQMAAVTRMSQIVAHDLRGPLGAIVQGVNLAKQDPNTIPDMLRIIEENAVRSLTMIAGWRSNTREITPQLRETDLVALINGVLEGVTMPEDVALSTSFSDDVKPLRLDPDLMVRVLNNLLENALEAMPSGGGLNVRVEVEKEVVLIRIIDTGVGIPDEAKEKIFSPLYSTKPGGMGLGLEYARRAVETLGGRIGFDSKVGEGTTFTIELPLKREGPSG